MEQPGGGDLNSIHAQFDAKYQSHVSSLDEVFAKNVQWLDCSVDDGMRQLSAGSRRTKRKQPDIPVFSDNKENSSASKCKPSPRNTQVTALADSEPNSPKKSTRGSKHQHPEEMMPPPAVVAPKVSKKSSPGSGSEGTSEADHSPETVSKETIPEATSPKLVKSFEERKNTPRSTKTAGSDAADNANQIPTRVSKCGLFGGVLPDDITKLTVVQLRKELKARNAETKGLKKVLVERLVLMVEGVVPVAPQERFTSPVTRKRTSDDFALAPNEDVAQNRAKRSGEEFAAKGTGGSPSFFVRGRPTEIREVLPAEAQVINSPPGEFIEIVPTETGGKTGGKVFSLVALFEPEPHFKKPDRIRTSTNTSAVPQEAGGALAGAEPLPKSPSAVIIAPLPTPVAVEPEKAPSQDTQEPPQLSSEHARTQDLVPALACAAPKKTSENEDLRRKIQMLTETQSASQPLAAQHSSWHHSQSESASLGPTELGRQLCEENVVVVDTATQWQPCPTLALAPGPTGTQVEAAPGAEASRVAPVTQISKHEAAAERRRVIDQKQKDERAAKETKREQAKARARLQLDAEEGKAAAEKERRERVMRAKIDAKLTLVPSTRPETAPAASPVAEPSPKLRMPSFQAENFKPVAKLSLEETNYSISPQRDSDDSDSDSEPEDKKKIPKWAQKPELNKALERQRTQDPDTIFPLVNTCDLTTIFGHNGDQCRNFAQRGESGLWQQDGLQMSEIQRWRKQMGFKS